jgi:uncharacterized membrane protein YphA (DoxX/SURF4 family)
MTARWLNRVNPIWAVRLGVGVVFLLEGIKKFLFPVEWGVGRFIKIGIPAPHAMAPFVGTAEVICGGLIIAGLVTQLAAIPLLIDITVAFLTTKLPLLLQKGFWAMEADARTDYAMFMGLLCCCRADLYGPPTHGRQRAR